MDQNCGHSGKLRFRASPFALLELTQEALLIQLRIRDDDILTRDCFRIYYPTGSLCVFSNMRSSRQSHDELLTLNGWLSLRPQFIVIVAESWNGWCLEAREFLNLFCRLSTCCLRSKGNDSLTFNLVHDALVGMLLAGYKVTDVLSHNRLVLEIL
jgi:hypothetical protein